MMFVSNIKLENCKELSLNLEHFSFSIVFYIFSLHDLIAYLFIYLFSSLLSANSFIFSFLSLTFCLSFLLSHFFSDHKPSQLFVLLSHSTFIFGCLLSVYSMLLLPILTECFLSLCFFNRLLFCFPFSQDCVDTFMYTYSESG